MKWLEAAFGFEPTMVVINEDGTLGHSEMRFGDGMIMVGREWDEKHQSPASLGGVTTQDVHIQLEDGIDAHVRTGEGRRQPQVVREPAGSALAVTAAFMVTDPEGHFFWSFRPDP